MEIHALVELQKDFFNSRKTMDIAFRKACLKKLHFELCKREKDIAKAMYDDFRKPEFESVMTETGIVLNELKLAIRKLNSWARSQYVRPVLVNFPSTNRIYKEPYGTVLIIAPWNYPFQLVFSPLVGAIAAGNTVVVKPSEHSPRTSRIVSEIIKGVFLPEHVSVVEGEADVAARLLVERWDYIFFTGSSNIGKIVAKAAAEHLTPVTLELGGKNPCIIDETANIKLAARRIVWGKFINCGQTCIAPDYVLVHESIKESFVENCRSEIKLAFGENTKQSPDYSRIINHRNFEVLRNCISDQKILEGGETDSRELYISPTLLDNPALDSPVMKQEIFGPILPVLSYKTENEIDTIISSYEKPLALYVFSKRANFSRRIIMNHSFGGGTINDTLVHFANHRLPFGGVGFSGLGAYHGKHSFETFTFKKGVTTRYNWLDVPVRYAPYFGKLKMLKFFMKWFS
ncbi:MAG: aldehyde dehydrogenase [Bacteroidota bacterium]